MLCAGVCVYACMLCAYVRMCVCAYVCMIIISPYLLRHWLHLKYVCMCVCAYVRSFMRANSNKLSRYVVEGANLFLTQDARLQLEKAGVILYKDASANKGGVTSSSLEVCSK